MIKIYLMLLFLCPAIAYAQEFPAVFSPNSNLELLPGHVIQICHYDSPKVIFSLSFDGENWKKFSITQNEQLLIDLINHDETFFRICTGKNEGCMSYKLKGTFRYRVFWNSKKNKWDLMSIDGK